MCTPEFVERQTTSNLTYYMFDGPLEQSVGDTRQHQLIKLPNNMVVLCTSDPDSAKAAASLSVNVGSMADPKEFPGMAHFLEHMLFMGSAKYPTENEYTEYIANNLEQNVYDISLTKLKQDFENIKFEQPVYQLVSKKNKQLNVVPFVPTSLLEQLLDQVTIEDVQKHIETVFSAAYFKMLVVGNFEPAEAVDAAQQVNQMLKSQPLPAQSHVPSRMVNIEPGHYIYRHMGEDPNMLNNAVVATFYCGMVSNPKDRTTMALLVQIVKDQFFGQIRTKEQLGYRVGAFTNSFSSGKLILELRVQGESNPTYLLQRIDSFIQGFRQTLAKFDTIKFDALVGSIVGKANEKVMSVDAKANRMWTPIDKGTYNFAQLADEVVSLQRVRLDDVLDMWDRYINPQTAVTYIRVDSQL
ncbi:hypothetical protein IWW49_001947, partial [Coemansia sp. RSA 1797]